MEQASMPQAHALIQNRRIELAVRCVMFAAIWMRQSLPPTEGKIAADILRSALRFDLLRADPNTRRAYAKPRGYGDFVMPAADRSGLFVMEIGRENQCLVIPRKGQSAHVSVPPSAYSESSLQTMPCQSKKRGTL